MIQNRYISSLLNEVNSLIGRPPVFNKAEEEVTTEKRVGYPLTDSQIGRLVDTFADNEHAAKWQFATQLCEASTHL